MKQFELYIALSSQSIIPVSRMAHVAPMLSTLGYDPFKNPPNYGQPDEEVANNTQNLRVREDYWRRRKDMLMEEMRKPTEEPVTGPEDETYRR